jgi:hypothetical protein
MGKSVFTFLILILGLATNISHSQDFRGYYHESGNSYVAINDGDAGYILTFSSNGTVYAEGVGNMIAGKLYFIFRRLDNLGDGGFGIYNKIGPDKLEAVHFNLDFTKRWSGIYNKVD